jgi:sulfate transport system permease protein
MPLYVEILYNDYQYVPAFTVASLLTLLALVTLITKSLLEWKTDRPQKVSARFQEGSGES